MGSEVFVPTLQFSKPSAINAAALITSTAAVPVRVVLVVLEPKRVSMSYFFHSRDRVALTGCILKYCNQRCLLAFDLRTRHYGRATSDREISPMGPKSCSNTAMERSQCPKRRIPRHKHSGSPRSSRSHRP